MSATGGSLDSLSLAGREFAVTGDADVTMKLGGFENEVLSNGNGTTRTIKTRIPWSLDGAAVEIDHDRGDLEFLQDLADSNLDFVVAATYVEGSVYQGTGQISGELGVASGAASAGFNLMGPGKLTKQ